MQLPQLPSPPPPQIPHSPQVIGWYGCCSSIVHTEHAVEHEEAVVQLEHSVYSQIPKSPHVLGELSGLTQAVLHELQQNEQTSEQYCAEATLDTDRTMRTTQSTSAHRPTAATTLAIGTSR